MFIPTTTLTQGPAAFSEWDLAVVKSVDETISASVALQNDNELLFPVTANVPYTFLARIVYSSNGTADFKHAFQLSTGAPVASTSWRRHSGLGPTTAVAQLAVVADVTTAIINAYAANFMQVEVYGAITNDATATFNFAWAQNVSDPVDTTVKAGSFLAWREMTS
jgi:hypothetical protein